MKYELMCPTDEWDCPYYKNGCCALDNAVEECDSFYGIEED